MEAGVLLVTIDAVAIIGEALEEATPGALCANAFEIIEKARAAVAEIAGILRNIIFLIWHKIKKMHA